MRFDELAANAGKAAADVGRGAERPSIGQVLAARRRALVAGWLISGAVVASIVGVVLLWPGSGSPSPLAGAVTTTTSPATTATSPPTTLVEGGREACPVTLPGDQPFTPASETPEGPPSSYESVWYGTPELWTMLNHQGEIWDGLPVAADGTLTQKVFWWSSNYVSSGQVADIIVTLEHLNGSTPNVGFGPGNGGGRADIGVFMVVGLDIPQTGCWRITAEFQDATLSYVAWAEGR